MSPTEWLLDDLKRLFAFDWITLAELESDAACLLRGGMPDRYVLRPTDTAVLEVMTGGTLLRIPCR